MIPFWIVVVCQAVNLATLFSLVRMQRKLARAAAAYYAAQDDLNRAQIKLNAAQIKVNAAQAQWNDSVCTILNQRHPGAIDTWNLPVN